MRCKICTQASDLFGNGIVLNKHNVNYYRCANCGFVQTEEPYWLDQAYSEAITRSDIGLAGRSIASAGITKAVIETFFDAHGKFLDYGGGYGLMVRLMRDAGFRYYRDDKFCANIFAQGFDADDVVSEPLSFELLTAFEVFEHLVQPIEEITAMLQFSPNILFSTTLLPVPLSQPDQWWYYGAEHGQHVSLYSYRSLEHLARRFGLHLYSDGRSLHMLTIRRLSERQFRLVVRYSRILSPFFTLAKRRKSLLPQDFFDLTGRSLT